MQVFNEVIIIDVKTIKMGLYSLQPIISWNIISFILSKGQENVHSQVHFYIELTSNVCTLTNVLACSSFLQHFST